MPLARPHRTRIGVLDAAGTLIEIVEYDHQYDLERSQGTRFVHGRFPEGCAVGWKYVGGSWFDPQGNPEPPLKKEGE
jgi:hypothetical protein